MKFELIIADDYCTTKKFKINGIDAYYDDFGYKRDNAPLKAPEFGCGDMRFILKRDPDICVLRKYGITREEYCRIANELESALSFGYCELCV